MKAYKVVWWKFEIGHSFTSMSDGKWRQVQQERFFGTEQAAQEFADKKNAAFTEISGYAPSETLAYPKEVELE